MCAYLKTGMYKLYPRHSMVPKISKAERILLAAQEILQKLQAATPICAQAKLNHNKTLKQLTGIFEQGPQRAASTQLRRVGATQAEPWRMQSCPPERARAPHPAPLTEQPCPPPRAGARVGLTTDPTDPETVCTTMHIQNRQTRANQHSIGEAIVDKLPN